MTERPHESLPVNEWPDPDAGRLCLACALCCDGVLFKDVELQNDENPAGLRALGLPLARRGRKTRLPQPCAALEGFACRVYPSRPVRCRDFACGLLKALQTGKSPFLQALRRVRETQAKAQRVRRLLRELGDHREGMPLSIRFRQLQQKAENFVRDDDVAEAYAQLTLAVHDLNLKLRQWFYPGQVWLKGKEK